MYFGVKGALVYLTLAVFFLHLTSFGQAGKHGVRVINGTAIVNEYTTLSANAGSGSMSLSVASSSLNSSGLFTASLNPGDLLFIIQMQGAQIIFPDDTSYGYIQNYGNCGNYEFVQVASVPNSTTITLECALQKNYTSAGRTQVIRVPRYSSLTINGSAVLTCPPWNGSTGGVLVVEVQYSTMINGGGSIDVSGKGFRGGLIQDNAAWWGVGNSVSTRNDYGAEKGEGIAGNQLDYDALGGRYSKGAPANGGGGANSHNAGGGGGANAGSPASWTGRGTPDISNAAWISGWNQEYPGFALSTSTGGGKGGYTFSASNQNALVQGTSLSAWGGDNRGEQGGRGGHPVDYSTGRIFMGGGGGAGDQNNSAGGVGGNGGGIVYLQAYGDVSGSGSILANGANGANTIGANGTDGAGGGGAGGTVMIPALGNISGFLINANGGRGGNQSVSFGTLEAEGPGGGGGGGYIAISGGAIAKTVTGGQNGTTNSFSLTEFPHNGATKGGAGEASAILPVYKIQVNSPQTVCLGASVTLSYSLTGSLPTGTTIAWYSAAVGGTLLGSGATYTLNPVTGNTMVYVGTCSGVYRVPIQINANQVSSSFTASTVCQGTASQFSGTATSSLGTITTWSWDFGDGTGSSSSQNPTYNYSIAGTYTVRLTVSDNLGCNSVSTNSVLVNPRPGIAISASPASGCLPLSIQFNNTSTNANNYTWNFGDGSAISSQTNPAHTYASSGNYSVTVTASNASGCTSSQTNTNMIQAFATPKAIFNASSTSVCLGDTIQFNDASVSNGAIITSRTWNFGDGSAPSNQTNPSHAYLNAGSYQVRLTVSSATCSHDTILTVLVNPGPIVSFSSDVNVGCNPLSVNFTNTTSGAPTYSWNFGDGSALTNSQSPSHTYLNSGTYSVTLIATQGTCADTLRIQSMVVVYPTPGASFNSATSACLGDTISFSNTSTSNGGITGYSWDFGDGTALLTSASPNHLYTSPGTYQVTLRCSTNQCIDDTVKTVVIFPAPQVSFASSVSSGCAPLNVSFSNSTSGSPTYQWDFGDGGSAAVATPSHTFLNAGTYSVRLIAVQGSCSDTLTLANLISVAPKPMASFSSSTLLCLGDTLFTQNNTSWNGGSSGAYIWNFGDGTGLSNAISPSHVYQAAGTYSLSLTATGSQCSDDSIITIQVAPSPQVAFSASQNSVCLGENIVFTNTTSGNPAFSWNFGDNSPILASRNPSYTYTASGTYTVSLIASQGSCADTLTIPAMINVRPSPLADFSFTSPCVGDSILFTNTSQAQGSIINAYFWNFGDGTAINNQQNPKHAFAVAGTYNVSLIVQSSNTCSDTIQKSISVLNRPQVSFNPDLTNGCDSLSVQFSNTSTGAATYTWSFGDGASSTQTSPSHTYSSAGTYSVLLSATAIGGCSASRAYVNLINVRSTPTAQFTSGTSTICPGECVSFQDQSSNDVTTWAWSFPGANPSSAGNANPASVCYPMEGVYDVSLSVSNGFCSTSRSMTNYIHVVDCSTMPVASFISSDSTVCGGSCLTFVSLSLNATSWKWLFPGATPSTSLLESPQNICYQNQGNFPVTLIAGNPSGSDTLVVTNHIQVFAPLATPTISLFGDSMVSSAGNSYQWYLNGIAISGATNRWFIASLSGNYSVETGDANSCTAVSAAKYVSLVGITETDRVPYLVLFPVPFSTELQLLFFAPKQESVLFNLYNALGKVILTETLISSYGENHFVIKTDEIASGVYWLELNIDNNIVIRRVLRQ
ncbi:MAG: PKD domain-containing protein [Bacteroidetes bacterium]|nr:MAG: PKD domain-containing protein [Bacteroidota bacterium]